MRDDILLDVVEIKKLCVEKDITLAVAESLTAGKIQDALASVPGASGYFLGGMTVYNLDAKVRMLGVSRKHAEEVNSVSRRVAQAMALGVARKFKADIGLATTGYAEPDPSHNVEKPFAYYTISTQHVPLVEGMPKVLFKIPARNEVREQVAGSVLNSLLELLREGTYI